jgi:hypothetical protein
VAGAEIFEAERPLPGNTFSNKFPNELVLLLLTVFLRANESLSLDLTGGYRPDFGTDDVLDLLLQGELEISLSSSPDTSLTRSNCRRISGTFAKEFRVTV